MYYKMIVIYKSSFAKSEAVTFFAGTLTYPTILVYPLVYSLS